MFTLKFFNRSHMTRCGYLFFLMLAFLLIPHSLPASTVLNQKISISLIQEDLPSIFNALEKIYNLQIDYTFPLPSDAQSITIQDVKMVEFLTTLLNNAGVKNCAILADDQNRVIHISNIEALSPQGTSSPSTPPTGLQPTKAPQPSSVTENAASPESFVVKGKLSPVPPLPDIIPPLPGTTTPINMSEIEARNKNAKLPESIILPDTDATIIMSEIEARNKNAKLPEYFTLPGQDTPILLSEVEARNKAVQLPESVNMPNSSTPFSPNMMEKRSKVTLLPEVPPLPASPGAASKQ